MDCGAPSLLATKLAKAAELGANLCIIDSPPHADLMARQAAKLADLVLIPCRPKAFDLAAVEATAELVRSGNKPAFVVFTAGPPRAPLIYREATALISGEGDDPGRGLPVAPVSLPDRAAFHHSTAQGLTAIELEPSGKAASEVSALWSWTCELRLQLGPRRESIAVETPQAFCACPPRCPPQPECASPDCQIAEPAGELVAARVGSSTMDLPAFVTSDLERDQAGTAYTFLDSKGVVARSLLRGEVAARTRHIAGTLAKLGARPLLILLPPGPDLVLTFLAGLRAQAVPVLCEPPTRTPLSRRRLESIVESCRARLAVAAPEFHELLRELRVEPITPEALEAEPETDWDDTPPRSSAPAYLQYTSGSTGSPKATVVTFGALADNLEAIRHGFGHDADSRGVIWLPPFHDMGLVGGVLQPLHVGFPVALMRPEDFVRRPHVWLQAVSEYRATTSGGPTFAWSLVTRSIRDDVLNELDLSRWRVAFVGAEPVRPEVLEQFAAKFASTGFRGSSFLPCYGLAEATLYVAGTRPGQELRLRLRSVGDEQITDVSCGAPWANFRLEVLDPEGGDVLPPGEIGEISLRGPSVAPYLPVVSDAAGIPQDIYDTGAVRTGDLGYLHNGELFVTGRLKAMIKGHGKKLLAEDVESAVTRAVPECRAVAAFGAQSRGAGEQLVVAVEMPPAHDPAQVRATILAAVVGATGVTPQIVLGRRGLLPRTVSGKVDRARLPEILSDSRRITEPELT